MPDRRPTEIVPVPDRLGSWKEIAVYLKTSVRSVQRWEKTEGLPTHRHVHDKRGSIYAYKSEIDHWWEGRRDRLKPEASSNERPRRPSLAVLLMTAVLGAGLGGSVLLLTNRKQPPLPLRLSVLPPPGSLFQFGIQSGGHAVSPDGTQLAFVATTQGRPDLGVRPLSAPAGHRLEGTEGSYYPFWSPDSRSIAFFAGGKLKRVDVSGGATQIVDNNVYGRGGAWGDDSTILFADFPSLERAGIFQISASGGRPARLTSIDASRGESLHEWPCLLPDGRFLYFIRSDHQEESGIYLGWRDSARNAHRTRILSTRSNAVYSREGSHSGSLFWVRDGALLAQRLNLRTLELKGQPVPVAQDVGLESVIGLAHASVSPAGVLSYDAVGREPTQLTWFDRRGKVLGTVGG